jgi:hypothetical protein
VQESAPERASVAVKLTVRAALYQPFAFGWREGVALATGAVASYLTGNAPLPTLPAWSLQVPEAEAAALSGPE